MASLSVECAPLNSTVTVILQRFFFVLKSVSFKIGFISNISQGQLSFANEGVVVVV